MIFEISPTPAQNFPSFGLGNLIFSVLHDLINRNTIKFFDGLMLNKRYQAKFKETFKDVLNAVKIF